METFSLDHWRAWQQQGCTRLPFALVVRDAVKPASWQAFAASPAVVLLESAQAGRYTYLCDRPHRLVTGTADRADVWTGDRAGGARTIKGKPLEVLETVLSEPKAPRLPGWPAMTGGLMGAIGYDAVHTWEQLPVSAKRERRVPLYAMIEPAELFVYDEVEQRLGIVIWSDVAAAPSALENRFQSAVQRSREALQRWQMKISTTRAGAAGGAQAGEPPAASFTPEGFKAAVERVQDYIAAGHTYQVNLSLRTSRLTALSPGSIYEALREVNPSPYMGLLQFPEFALVCGSPELLVRQVDGRVSSRPIAGTRPRGDAVAEDSHFSAELFASEKERAEHLMLVDLIRNDIGRVADFGSVHVTEFMVLERYSHVMHIVSEVEGRLAAGRTWVEVFQAMFPGGTITGCPKIRTMEIIEELEPVGRDFYTGALGWISYAGEMEMNIVIRSMLLSGGIAHVQAGAGIVADSQPERELDEARRKAQALWVALEKATHAHDRSQ